VLSSNRIVKEMLPPHRKSLARLAGLALLMTVSVPTSAHAYFDPGTGSMLMQALVAAVVGLAFTLRGLRSRLAALARRLFRSE
jgi:hypothetical protein